MLLVSDPFRMYTTNNAEERIVRKSSFDYANGSTFIIRLSLFIMEKNQTIATQVEDCIVLLEELIRSNRELAEENARLRQEHERASQQHADALKRIERRLDAGEVTACHRRRVNTDNIVVPSSCRVSK